MAHLESEDFATCSICSQLAPCWRVTQIHFVGLNPPANPSSHHYWPRRAQHSARGCRLEGAESTGFLSLFAQKIQIWWLWGRNLSMQNEVSLVPALRHWIGLAVGDGTWVRRNCLSHRVTMASRNSRNRYAHSTKKSTLPWSSWTVVDKTSFTVGICGES